MSIREVVRREGAVRRNKLLKSRADELRDFVNGEMINRYGGEEFVGRYCAEHLAEIDVVRHALESPNSSLRVGVYLDIAAHLGLDIDGFLESIK